MRTYNKAPLPFLGQKRYWLTELREQKLFREPELVIVDLFGGSGLVSHTLKQVNSALRVIWNDYDNYLERLAMINETEALRLKLREYAHIKTRSRVGESDKSQMAAAIKEHWKQYGRCDWITLSSWLLYSGNYAHDYDDLVRRGWYYSVIKSPLSADGYLKGVERVCEDFRSLYER